MSEQIRKKHKWVGEDVKINWSIPMFEKGELEIFDNNIHSIVEKYSKLMFKEKDQILTQRIIMKQEEEIDNLQNQLQQKENIIKEVREKIKELCWDYEYETYSNMTSDEVKELAELLDKEVN